MSYLSSATTLGDESITSTYEGAIYWFANTENKSKFDADPQKDIPQYGGFCAIAISEGKTFPVDPQNYIISDDKLYLFYNGKLGNTKPDWEKDPETRRVNTDKHWKDNDLNVVYPTSDY